MILSEFWGAVTALSIIAGFVAGRRDGLDIYNRQFPPPQQWLMPVHPGTDAPPMQVRPLTATPYRNLWLRCWGQWVLNVQAAYWAIQVVITLARNDTNIAAPIVAATGYLWLVPVGLLVGGVLWLLLRAYLAHRPVEVVEEQPQAAAFNPAPSLAKAPTQQQLDETMYHGPWGQTQ